MRREDREKMTGGRASERARPQEHERSQPDREKGKGSESDEMRKRPQPDRKDGRLPLPD